MNTKINFVTDYQPDAKAFVELKNGNFFDVVNGKYYDTGTKLIICEGKIVSILSNREKSEKVDFSIDLNGKTVLPGLFNTHNHINMTTPSWFPTLKEMLVWKLNQNKQKIKNMAECLAHGVTNIRDSYTENLMATQKIKTGIDNHKIYGPRIQQAVVVGPDNSYFAEKSDLKRRLSRSAVCVETLNHSKKNAGVIQFSINADTQTVRDSVNRAIDERGADAIKIGEQLISTVTNKPDATIMTMDQLCAITDQADKRGLKTIIHQITADTFRRAVSAGVSSVAHLALDSELTQDDIDAFISAGCILEPTLSVQYDLAWQVDGSRFNDHPDMERLMNFRDLVYTYTHIGNEFYVKGLRDSLNRAYKKFKDKQFELPGNMDLSKLYRFYSGMVHHGNINYRNLFQSGAAISASNDAGIPPCTPAMIDLEFALSDLILNSAPKEKKFNGADAAKMATINSARALGLEDDFGSIEAGKTADLVILEGDLLEDYRVVGSRADALFMDGKLVVNNCGLQVSVN